jgi:hypothetical protein
MVRPKSACASHSFSFVKSTHFFSDMSEASSALVPGVEMTLMIFAEKNWKTAETSRFD